MGMPVPFQSDRFAIRRCFRLWATGRQKRKKEFYTEDSEAAAVASKESSCATLFFLKTKLYRTGLRDLESTLSHVGNRLR
jgi:hypothetical protein